MTTPPFWKGRIEDVDAAVAEIRRGTSRVVTRSPGGRPVHLVSFGDKPDLRRRANYNSATGSGDPKFYADKSPDAPPIVFLVGPTHGQEPEGVVGILNLIHVAETGADWRGKEWRTLRETFDGCRVLIVPLANPDGRARCPYDSFVGMSVQEMTRVGQGTRKDGTAYGWPGAKRLHPMVGDVGFLGAYFNDDGINPMHDEFFAPMAAETKALLDIARDEAPDYLLNLHSHGVSPEILRTAYVPWYCKEIESAFGERLRARFDREGLPSGNPPTPRMDGEKYPPPAFNLTSALHHVCGGVSMLYEQPHGLIEYVQVTHDQILDMQLLLFEELLTFAGENPCPGQATNGKR